MKIETICIYHGNCFDGMTSALVVKKAMSKFPHSRNVEYWSAFYGDGTFNALKKLEDKEMLFVDFSLPREQLLELNEKNDVYVLDHHQTAEKDLKDLPFCKFDMNESGATLAWKHFFPTLDTPTLVQYIRDRDLWKFELPYSKEVNAYIQSYPIEMAAYEALFDYLSYANLGMVMSMGQSILRYINSSVGRICDYYYSIVIDNHMIPCVQNNGILQSEIGNELCRRHTGCKFSASVFFDGHKQVYSLRSIGDFDVSEVAKKFGGGGHKNAAGFTLVSNTILMEVKV